MLRVNQLGNTTNLKLIEFIKVDQEQRSLFYFTIFDRAKTQNKEALLNHDPLDLRVINNGLSNRSLSILLSFTFYFDWCDSNRFRHATNNSSRCSVNSFI